MKRYQLKIIFKSKIFRILFIVMLFIGTTASLSLSYYASGNTYETEKRYLQQTSVEYKTLKRMEDHSLKVGVSESVEGKLKNRLKYYSWVLESYDNLENLLDEEGLESEAYQKERLRVISIVNLSEHQEMISEENDGVEVRLKDLMDAHEAFLKINDLPYSFTDLKGGGYSTADMKEANDQAYENFISMCQYILIGLDSNSQNVEIMSGSPYSYLEYFCGVTNEVKLIPLLFMCLGIIIIFQWKSRNSYSSVLMVNGDKTKCFYDYFIEIIGTSILLLIITIGLWTVYWGAKYGWNGLNGSMFVDPKNFSSFKTFEHEADYHYVGLSRIYYDLIYDFGYGQYTVTRYNYVLIPLWKFLIRFAVLELLKIITYVYLGCTIGFYANKKISLIVLGGAIGIVSFISQVLFEPTKFNPFSVGSCWRITQGGESITWLNAIILLGSLLIILSLINRVLTKKDFL